MNIWDIVMIAVIAAAVFVAVIKIVRDKRRGKSCCGECSACPGCDKKNK